MSVCSHVGRTVGKRPVGIWLKCLRITICNSICGKVMFSQACQEFCPQGEVYTPQTHPPRQTPHPPAAIAADGAYPTGMHSCLFLVLHSWTVVTRSRMEIPECCRDSGSQEKGSIQQILQQGEERKGKLVRILILILCSLLAPSSCRWCWYNLHCLEKKPDYSQETEATYEVYAHGIQDCISVGCVAPTCYPYLLACTAPGGGGLLPGGVCSGPGGCIPACNEADPPFCEQNDRQVQKYYLAQNFVCGR